MDWEIAGQMVLAIGAGIGVALVVAEFLGHSWEFLRDLLRKLRGVPLDDQSDTANAQFWVRAGCAAIAALFIGGALLLSALGL